MQVESYKTEDVSKLIQEAQHIAVVPSKISGADAFTAAVGLHFMLQDMGKDSKLVYIGKTPEEATEVIEEDELFKDISMRDLVVSIDYAGTRASKVHYKTKGDVLEFRLGPIPKNFDTNKVISKVDSLDFDLIIVIGTQHLPDLGIMYRNLEEEFRSAKIINIDNTKRNTRFGVVNVIDDTADTLSLLIFKHASSWGLVPNKRSAKALLTGMTYREAKKAV